MMIYQAGTGRATRRQLSDARKELQRVADNADNSRRSGACCNRRRLWPQRYAANRALFGRRLLPMMGEDFCLAFGDGESPVITRALMAS